MAKKKKDENPTVEEAIQEIQNEKVNEFLGEDVNESEESTPEESKETSVKEEKVEETKPEFDAEKLQNEIVEKVSKNTADQIAKALGSDEEATAEQKDKYQQIADDFLKEKGRNPTWFELIPFIVEDAKSSLHEDSVAQKEKEEETIKQQKEEEKVRTDAFNKHIDEQLEELYTSGKLPKIVNKDDANDLGVRSRKALFQAMLEVNQARSSTGQEPVYSLKEIFYEHYKPVDEQPAGADAPVSMGRGAIAHDDSDDNYSYAEISKPRSISDLFLKSIGRK